MQGLVVLIAALACTDAIVLRSSELVRVAHHGGTHYHGNPDCACIGIDALEGDTTVDLKDGKKSVSVDFPADLGARCEAWDADVDEHPSCPGESWCKQKWCYVDPCKCKNVGDLPKPSSYMPNAQYQGKPLHYSYATCGGTDSFAEEEMKKTAKQLEETCAVEVDSAKWGMEDCRCVGVGPQEGTTKVTIDGELVEFPADTGAMCKKWEEDRHPSCKGDSPPSWCSQAWCYVDPCSCKSASPPKTSSYLPESNYQGKPVYYSYATCGGTDSYSSGDENACVNKKTSGDCSKLEKCAWTGSECLGKELVSVCKATTDTEEKYLRPIGEGAHQDPKAVKQRTTDKNMDCEHGNWNDCHSPDGDYVKDSNGKVKAKSGAAPVASAVGSLLVLLLAAAQ